MNKKKETKKFKRYLALALCLSLGPTSFSPIVAHADYQEAMDKASEAYGKYDTYVKPVENIYNSVQEAQKAEEAVNAASGAGTAAKAAADAGGIKNFGDGVNAAGDAMALYGDLSSMESPGDIANVAGDAAGLAGDFGAANADEMAGAAGIVGSVFGQKISDSMSYRSVGNNVIWHCSSGTPYPTINEEVEVRCVAAPTGRAQWVMPMSWSYHATPSHGGKATAVTMPSVGWRCGHHGCYPVGSAVATIEYNTYEGDVTMGGDMYFDFSKYNNSEFNSFEQGEYNPNGYQYDPNSYGSSSGSISDATGDFFANIGSGGYGDIGDIANGKGGYNWNLPDYDAGTINDMFNDKSGSYNADEGSWSGAGGHYDADGNWHDSGAGNGYYDADGNWHGGSSAGGYYDADGNWNDGSTSGYDANGNWHEGDSGSGYYDADGNWHNGSSGSDNLDDYFGGAGGDGVDGNTSGTNGLSSDITGFGNENAGTTTKDILANGGYVGDDGQVYDAEGNSWGSAEKSGLIPMEEGSDQLNNILAEGGWVDEQGNIHDANSNVVGYLVKAGSRASEESEAWDNSSTLDKLDAYMQELMKSLGKSNDGESSLMEQLTGKKGDGSNILDALKSTFGMKSSEDVRKDTMTPQQMFDAAHKILNELGYTDEQLAKGENYDKDSAYTEPDKAWDMNRITTLQKNFKINSGLKVQKPTAITKASSSFNMVRP